MKGQKAIGLWMPITLSGKSSADEKATVVEDGMPRRIFVMRNNWFAYSQTQVDPRAEEQTEAGSDEETETQPLWNQTLALETLGISMIPYRQVDGNMQGYAQPKRKAVAISPVAAHPLKTLLHEIAHVVMHGEDEEFVCGVDLDRAVKEVEAESVAFLCSAALSLPGLDESRGYVQHWLGHAGSRDVLKKSAGRIFSAADRILKAGFPQAAKVAAEPATA